MKVRSPNESNKKAAAKDLLLEDFRYLTDCFWKNEQIGETRVNWFIGIVAAGVGGLFSLVGLEHRPPAAQLRLMIVVSLFGLLCFGLVTLFRLIKRNENAEGYKHDCDVIRQIFRDHFDDDRVLAQYHPLGKRHEPRKRKFGGLAHFVLTINSLLVAGVAGAVIYPFGKNETLIWTDVMGILAFVSAFIYQLRYVTKRDKKARQELPEISVRRENVPTHAGGVVYRIETVGVKYLLVGPKKDFAGEWLLPKGHIETGEEPAAAAVREVREEAGVLAGVISPIGTNEFETSEEKIVVSYFLMERFFDWGKDPTDPRRVDWFGFDDAVKSLTHVENKYLLYEAERKRLAQSRLSHGSDGAGSVCSQTPQ